MIHKLRSATSGLLYGRWRRAVRNGQALIGREELQEQATSLRPRGRLWIRTDHYQIHGMPPPPLLQSLAGEHDDPGAFLSLLPGAELIGRHCTAVWRDRVVLESILGSAGYLLQHGDPRALLFRRFHSLQDQWPVALILANHLNSNYFHWVTEALPLLEALEQGSVLGVAPDEPLLVVNAPVPAFVWQWLEIFGIDPKRVRPWSHNRVRVEKLLMPSLRYGRLIDEHPLWARHLYPRWAFEFVRQRALASVASQRIQANEDNQRVFLSRPRVGGRGLANHDEVLVCLQRHGYKEVFAEHLNVRQQIALFASLTHLVAIHGAGMVNLIFSSQVQLIELFPSNRHFGFTYQFLQISAHFCDRHHLLACPADDQQTMNVPIQELDALLMAMAHCPQQHSKCSNV